MSESIYPHEVIQFIVQLRLYIQAAVYLCSCISANLVWECLEQLPPRSYLAYLLADNIWHLHSLSTDRLFLNVNSSVRKIYILRPNRDQLRKMQLQDLQLGIEDTALDLQTNALPTEQQKPLCIYTGGNAGEAQGYIKDNICHLHSLSTDRFFLK